MKPYDNDRIIGGIHQSRRFAYLHKRDKSRFGLLEATDLGNARDYLGRDFYIKETWLTLKERHKQAFDRDFRWQIVSSIFLDSLSREFIGHSKLKALSESHAAAPDTHPPLPQS